MTQSDIVCFVCHLTLGDCTCEDADQRMREATNAHELLMKWCMVCDKHFARCKCEKPHFGYRTGGKVFEFPAEGMLTLDGRRVFPDPHTR